MKPSAESSGRPLLATVFAGLLVLLALSAGSTFLSPAPWKTAAGLAIAVAKTALIALFFMRLKYRRGLILIFAGAGLFWLAILSTLLMSDYLTRGGR
jgi:cytochrome c oxidase subunit 4